MQSNNASSITLNIMSMFQGNENYIIQIHTPLSNKYNKCAKRYVRDTQGTTQRINFYQQSLQQREVF